MTHATKRAPRLTAISGAAALLLAGCSTGYIGETWQCPLAEGGLCDSVAAADPAVPDAKAAGSAVLAEPLWRVRGDGLAETPLAREPALPARGPGQAFAIRGPGQAEGTPCSAACSAEFDPFAWLARLFGDDPDSGEGRARPATADTAPEPAASSTARAETEPRPSDPATALLPAEPGPAQEGPDAGDLRTDEVVARIWIAPFVDADGVYREAGHVRVVLEPAGWRLP